MVAEEQSVLLGATINNKRWIGGSEKQDTNADLISIQISQILKWISRT